MIVPTAPPRIRATGPEDLARAARAAGAVDRARLLATPRSRRMAAAGLGYFASSQAGRRFLARAAPRALARGDPAARCPASGQAGPAADRGAAARAALSACLAALPGDAADCGCRLIALDDMALIPIAEAAYAVGVPARLSVPALGVSKVLVAEERDGGALALFGLTGPAGRIERLGGRRVRVVLPGLGAFEGAARPIGLRRGRLAERIAARDPEGRRLTLVIGGPEPASADDG